MKRVGKILLGTVTTFTLMTATISPQSANNYHKNYAKFSMKNFEIEKLKSKLLGQIKQGYIPLLGGVKLNLLNNAIAADSAGDPSCETIRSEAQTMCDNMWLDSSNGGYEHGALKYFNNSLCWVNKLATADAENVLCHFDKSMEIKPNLAALPFSVTKEFNNLTIKVTLSKPSESFAEANGYEAKGVVEVDGKEYMVIYWGGKGTESSGYLIEGNVAGLGGDRASYLTWDLRDHDAETVQILKSEFPSGEMLSDVSAGDNGDHNIYGKVVFNNTTKEVETQMVLIANQRGANDGVGFGCFKMYAQGTYDGEMVVAKTRDEISSDNFNDTGHAVTSTSKDLTDMDGAQLDNLPTTTNGTGNLGGATAADMKSNVENALGIDAGTEVFDKSCADINNASDTGVFSHGTKAVDFTLSPSDVF